MQYFTESTGTIESFNYNSGITGGGHLVNQDYCACVRSERTACSICYWVPDANYGLSSGTVFDSYCGVQAYQFAPANAIVRLLSTGENIIYLYIYF